MRQPDNQSDQSGTVTCARHSGWCDGELCRVRGIDCPNAGQIAWVGQEHAMDCGAAVIAMLTERPITEVRAQIDAELGHGRSTTDWNGAGITEVTIDRYLWDAGYFMQERRQGQYAPDTLNEHVVIGGPPIEGGWPPPPWADLHYAKVKQPSGNYHFVVMLRDGTVLDPMTREPRRLTDFASVNLVVGLVRTEEQRRVA